MRPRIASFPERHIDDPVEEFLNGGKQPRPRRSPEDTLRKRLESAALRCLAIVKTPIADPIAVHVSDEFALIEIKVSPSNAHPAPQPPMAWKLLSRDEKIIVSRLREFKAAHPDRPVAGKNLARLCVRGFDSAFRAVVKNLVDRAVLIHDDRAGYEPGYSSPKACLPACLSACLSAGPSFSPAETQIVNFIDGERARGRRIFGKNIASGCGMEYGPKIKAIIGNLVDRCVLHHDGTDGYTLVAESDERR